MNNPRDLQISSFSDQRPRGFGLMQRARRYDDFEDAEASYQRRPSLWIEPIGDWGKGGVELVEIPTDKEINDNIVAYWRPDGATSAGTPLRFSYRMRWTDEVLPPPGLLWVSASRAGLSFDQKRRLFVVDFRASDDSGKVDIDRPIGHTRPRPTASSVNAVVHDVEPNGALRVSFELILASEKLPSSGWF